MKLGLYWAYATRSLWRGGQRTLLAIFCVVVGVMAIVSLRLVGASIGQSLTSNVRDSNGGDLSISSNIVNLRADQLKVFDQLKSQGKITQYTAVSGHAAQADAANGTTQYFQLRAVDPAVYPLAGAPTFLDPSDEALTSALTNDGVVLTKTLATNLKVKVGGSVTITSDDGRALNGAVTGIIASAGAFQRPQALVSLADYAALTSSSGLPVTYSNVYANVQGHTDANAASAKAAIGKQLPTVNVTTTKDAIQQRSSDVQNIQYFLEVVGLLSLLIGGVGIVNTMQVLLRRRQTEIAVLKTSGYRRGDLYALFGLEAGLLGLLGGAIGAAAGLGVSILVHNLVVQRFFIDLPTVFDPQIIGSGVLIGVATALIFGLMPIVQAAQIRPLAVLRGVSEGNRAVGVGLTIFLFLLLAALFYGLSYAILGNAVVAAESLGGAGLALGLLSGIFFVLVLAISRFPIPERLTWWYWLIAVASLVVGGYLYLNAPAFGSLILALAALITIAPFLPRTPKANTRMALRNLGRDSGRSVTTMVALFVGVFGIGLILALGQNIKDEINAALSQQVKYNSFLLVGVKDQPAVERQIQAQSAALKSPALVTNLVQDAPVLVNGTPINQVLANAPTGFSAKGNSRGDALGLLSSVQGYNLSGGSLPGATLVRGANATEPGRLLGRADSGTLNVIMPYSASLAPLNLKVGDTITLESAVASQEGSGTGKGAGSGSGPPTGKGKAPAGAPKGPIFQPVTLQVVGFYQGSITTFAPVLADASAVNKLAGGTQFYVYAMQIDPVKSDQVLNTIRHNVKGVLTFSIVDLTLAINSLLNNLIIVLTAIASLAMVAGVIIIANAVGLAMLERRREIGILKSVGYTSSNVMNGVLVENGMIGFTGSLVAMLIVTLANFILDKYVFMLNFGAGPLISTSIVAATTLVCMLVAAAVAWSATRVRPLEVLRYE
jgi:putative ABC transport system permease protein